MGHDASLNVVRLPSAARLYGKSNPRQQLPQRCGLSSHAIHPDHGRWLAQAKALSNPDRPPLVHGMTGAGITKTLESFFPIVGDIFVRNVRVGKSYSPKQTLVVGSCGLQVQSFKVTSPIFL